MKNLLVPACLLLGLAGCAQQKKPTPLPTWRKPELLYLLAEPYSRLHVEIDTVEGAEPDKGGLAALKEFLQTHCSKPDGIEFVRDKPIPLAEAKGMHPHGVAMCHMDGPPRDAGAVPRAYLYVLFYNSKHLGARNTRQPHVGRDYPCAIYYDVAHQKNIQRYYVRAALKHEAGHVLGLCKGTDHGDGVHCADKDCLMRPKMLVKFSISRWLLRRPQEELNAELCEQCRRDIETAKKQPPSRHMSFGGPALLRQEEGYCVASLPFHLEVSLRAAEDVDGWEILAKVRRTIAELKAKSVSSGRHQVMAFVKCYHSLTGTPEQRRVLERITKDPDRSVAAWARITLKQLDSMAAKPSPQTQRVASQPKN